jgi:CheY-like chemotaxis protein
MPFMDGYQCSEMIRAYLYSKGVNQPIIVAMTGLTEKKHIERALNSGMNMVMFKPCNQIDLKKLIDDIGFEKIKPVENRLESLLPLDTEIIDF